MEKIMNYLAVGFLSVGMLYMIVHLAIWATKGFQVVGMK